MAATARKAIAAALLKQLIAGGQFTKTGRRDRAPEQAATPGKPGLFLIKPKERYRYDDNAGIPPVRHLRFVAVIYTDVGNDENAVPADVIDDLLDAIDIALAPTVADQLGNGGRQSLGGLVYDCRVDDADDLYLGPGDAQGKGQTLVPIVVTLSGYP